MPPETQAEFFIRTIAELHEEYRTRHATQQRLQQKTKAAKFIQTFPANRNESQGNESRSNESRSNESRSNESRSVAKWTQRYNHAWQQNERQSQAD